ncbi:hypothetical protein Tco_0506660 [Tanacetum coccineum]
MKYTEHYRMYVNVFGIDVPLTQSQPTDSTQGMHRTHSAPRSPNPNMDTGVSSALKRSTVIRFRIPQRRSTRLNPPALGLTVDKADEMILQDTLQVSLVEHKSREEQEARENVELVNEHLASVEIEKMVEGLENVIDDSLTAATMAAAFYGLLACIVVRLMMQPDVKVLEVLVRTNEHTLLGFLRVCDYPTASHYCNNGSSLLWLVQRLPGAPR